VRAVVQRACPRQARKYAEGDDGVAQRTDQSVRSSFGGSRDRPPPPARSTNQWVAADRHRRRTTISVLPTVRVRVSARRGKRRTCGRWYRVAISKCQARYNGPAVGSTAVIPAAAGAAVDATTFTPASARQRHTIAKAAASNGSGGSSDPTATFRALAAAPTKAKRQRWFHPPFFPKRRRRALNFDHRQVKDR